MLTKQEIRDIKPAERRELLGTRRWDPTTKSRQLEKTRDREIAQVVFPERGHSRRPAVKTGPIYTPKRKKKKYGR